MTYTFDIVRKFLAVLYWRSNTETFERLHLKTIGCFHIISQTSCYGGQARQIPSLVYGWFHNRGLSPNGTNGAESILVHFEVNRTRGLKSKHALTFICRVVAAERRKMYISVSKLETAGRIAYLAGHWGRESCNLI